MELIRLLGPRHVIDARPRARPEEGVVRSQLHRYPQIGGGPAEPFRQAGQPPGQLDEAAAHVHTVQRALEVGPQFVLEVEEGPGLGHRFRPGLRGQPLGLFREAGAEEVAVVLGEGHRPLEPSLVAAGSVGVETENEVPGRVHGPARPVGPGEIPGQSQGRHAADRFIGMRPRDHQCVPAPPPYGQQPYRLPGP